MKVVFVNTRYKPQAQAGPAFFVEYLAEQLVRENDGTAVVCQNLDGYEGIDEINGVLIYRLSPALTPNETAQRLLDVMAAECPDVIHTNMLKGFDETIMGPIAREVGAKLVHTLHEYRIICVNGTLFDNGRPCEELCPQCQGGVPHIERFVQEIDAVTSVSRYTLDRHLREGFFTDTPVKRIIFNPYVAVSGCEANPGGEGNTLRMGFLGRVCVDKGIEVLFRELAALPSELKYTLDIGGSYDQEQTEQLTRDFPGVPARFLGFVPQEQLLTKIDLLLVPSIFLEPLGRVVLEAYAYGVPVIATRLGGTPEIVDDGETGLIFDPLQSGDLKSKIVELASDRDRIAEMGKKALARSSDFLPKRILAEFREVYTQV